MSNSNPDAPYNEKDYDEKECTECLGTGEIPGNFPSFVCPYCGGKGVIPRTEEDEQNDIERSIEQKRDANSEDSL